MGQPARSEEKKQKTFRITQPLQLSDLVLAKAFVGALFLMVKNKLDQAVSIDDSGTCNASLLPPERLFTKPLKQSKEFQPINSDFCAPTVNISCAHRLAPPLPLLFLSKSYLNSF